MHREKDPKGGITPMLDRCSLALEGHSAKPLRVSPVPPRSYGAGGLSITIEGNRGQALKAGEDKALWTARSRWGSQLLWLGTDQRAVYLTPFDVEKKWGAWRPVTPARVLRLEVASGT